MCSGSFGKILGGVGKMAAGGVAKEAGLPGLTGGVAGMLLKKRKDKRPVAAVQPASVSMGG